jgi:hypothetical protein
MNWQNHIYNYRYDFRQWKLLGFLLFTLLMGCNVDDPEEKARAVNSEHGKQVEVNGEKFRIIYIGGVRFRFPDTNQFGWTGPFSTEPTTDGVDISLYWPDIPPGKAPGTKYLKTLDGNNYGTNQVEVIVRGTVAPIVRDPSQTVEERWRLNSDEYIVRDNLELGLKTFVAKNTPKEMIERGYAHYAYSITKDALEPWSNQPVVVNGEFITFMYSPQVSVRISMMGWGGYINPDWKGIYLGVVETLNKYRETN